MSNEPIVDLNRRASPERLQIDVQQRRHAVDICIYLCLDRGRRPVSGDADDARTQFKQTTGGHEPGLGAARRRRMHNGIRRGDLLEQLEQCMQIRESSERCRSADRNLENAPAFTPQPSGGGVHGLDALFTRLDIHDFGAKQRIEQCVRARVKIGRASCRERV